MAVDDDDFNIVDLQDLNLGDLSRIPSFHEFPESQLCVPTDSLEDLEWFPSFSDDFISLNESSFCFDSGLQPRKHDRVEKTKQQTSGVVEEESVGISEAVLGGFTKKKGRTKKKAKRDLVVGITRKRCSHCDTEETPQWRNGPFGPKTLCNACGVRFKSGRLLPEYRPAASPSFDGCRHSNYHKKIMEKRGLHC